MGNVEAKEVPLGRCDVIVTDGFTGNVFLKLTEGLGAFLLSKLKECFYENIITKASALLLHGSLKKMKIHSAYLNTEGLRFLVFQNQLLKRMEAQMHARLQWRYGVRLILLIPALRLRLLNGLRKIGSEKKVFRKQRPILLR